MSIEAGFLQDICAHPDDVAPRLVYADWLDDRGGKGDAARAEFIRLQCRPDGSTEREQALLAEWGRTWLKPFKALFARHEFRRGFVERVTMKAYVFIEQGEAILNQTPLRHVKLRDPKVHVPELQATKALERLDGLNLNYGNLGATRVKQLFRSPHLGKIRWLDLGNNNIGFSGLEAMLQASQHFANLRFLALDDNRLGDAGVTGLARSPLMGQLQALNLDGNDLTDACVDHLANSEYAGELVQLHLMRNSPLTHLSLRRLLTSDKLPNLRKVFPNEYMNARELDRLRKDFPHVDLDNSKWDAKLDDGPVANL